MISWKMFHMVFESKLSYLFSEMKFLKFDWQKPEMTEEPC
jgi:hypothetical protein